MLLAFKLGIPLLHLLFLCWHRTFSKIVTCAFRYVKELDTPATFAPDCTLPLQCSLNAADTGGSAIDVPADSQETTDSVIHKLDDYSRHNRVFAGS